MTRFFQNENGHFKSQEYALRIVRGKERTKSRRAAVEN